MTAAITAIVLVGCGPQTTAPSPNEPTDEPTSVQTSNTPVWDQASHAAAQQAGKRLLSTWARPTMAYQAWWEDLKGLLSPEARELYEYTDPAQIPTLKIAADGIESNNDNPHLVTITFGTTQGKFGVDLSRTSIPGEWIGESIIFPGEVSRLQG